MPLKTLGRFLGALCLAGSLTYAASGPASAAAPNWKMTVVTLPDTVRSGANAGYEVTIQNNGTSNISALYLRSTGKGLSYTDNSLCSAAGDTTLYCSFGALAAGGHVTIVVAFTATGSSFVPGFYANTTGATLSDKGKNSHGDSLFATDANGNPVTPTTTVSSSKDFGGGFVLGTDGVSTDPVGGNNNQQTTLNPPGQDLVTTVQDGPGNTQTLGNGTVVTFNCPAGNTCIGDWSRIFVRSVANFGDTTESFTTAFKVVLTLKASLVSNASSLQLVHITDDGVTHTYSQANSCGTFPNLTNVDNCLDVKKTGNTYTLTTWVTQNGGMKGMT